MKKILEKRKNTAGRREEHSSQKTIGKHSKHKNCREKIESSQEKNKQAKRKGILHAGNTNLNTTDFSSGTEGKEKLDHL